MNKIIIKTAIITVLSLVVASIIGVVCAFSFAPRFSGNCCFELGLKDMATKCYERAYLNSGTYEDLVELVDSAIYAEYDEMIAKYGEEMVERKVEFKRFCEDLDVDVDYTEGGYSTYDYYANATMLAKYYLGDKEGAVDFVFDNLFTNGYTENSALKMLVNMVSSEEGLGEMLSDEYLELEPASRYAFTNHEKFREDMKALGFALS